MRWPTHGCLFVISAFESVNDAILDDLDKGHTAADGARAIAMLRDAGIEPRPTWLPFTPWSTVDDIRAILEFVAEHDLVGNVDPVQYSIRLLVPEGSLLLGHIDDLGAWDAEALSYAWSSPFDALAREFAAIVEAGAEDPPGEVFNTLRALVDLPPVDVTGIAEAPRLSESWFCCAEPTSVQLSVARTSLTGAAQIVWLAAKPLPRRGQGQEAPLDQEFDEHLVVPARRRCNRREPACGDRLRDNQCVDGTRARCSERSRPDPASPATPARSARTTTGATARLRRARDRPSGRPERSAVAGMPANHATASSLTAASVRSWAVPAAWAHPRSPGRWGHPSPRVRPRHPPPKEHPMSTAPLEQAIAVTRQILAGVSPDQLGDSTPCATWKVSDLINHIVGGQAFFEAGVLGEPPAGTDVDFAAGDFVATFDDASARCVAAFQTEGVMEKMLTLPFGQMPGAAFVGLATTDTFTHGWDLAKATGQPTDLAPDLAAEILEGARSSIQPAFRSEEGTVFGLEQPAPAAASNADRLAAFLGRKV